MLNLVVFHRLLSLWVRSSCVLLALDAPVSRAMAEELSTPRTLKCVTGDTVVFIFEHDDARSACLGAADARAFLNAKGFVGALPVAIHIVKTLPQVGHRAFGCFDRQRGRIDLLSSSACRTVAKDGRLFGLPLDQTMYRSLAAHEVAHAIADANTPAQRPYPPWVVDEYIAYVTQLATLPEHRRSAILARYDEQGFATSDDISPYILLASPEIFAVKSYRHFSRQENGAAFLRELVAGKVQVHDERPVSPIKPRTKRGSTGSN